MKRNFPEIDHQFDVWHLAKSITKNRSEMGTWGLMLNCIPFSLHAGGRMVEKKRPEFVMRSPSWVRAARSKWARGRGRGEGRKTACWKTRPISGQSLNPVHEQTAFLIGQGNNSWAMIKSIALELVTHSWIMADLKEVVRKALLFLDFKGKTIVLKAEQEKALCRFNSHIPLLSLSINKMVSANVDRAIWSALDSLATRERSVVRLLQQ